MTDVLTTSGPGMGSSTPRIETRPPAGGKTAATVPAPVEDKRLDDVCREFESLFIYQLLKEMRASVPGDGYLGRSMQSETYTSMFDLEIARELSSQRGIGLAGFLRRQLADRLGDAEIQTAKKELQLD